MRIGIHWFRRDLRLEDNTALIELSRHVEKIIPVYIVSNWTGAHPWTGSKRQNFLCSCLEDLDTQLRRKGGRLICRTGSAPTVLNSLIEENNITHISFNHDYDPHGIYEELEINRLANQHGIIALSCKNRVMHEADEVLTKAKKPFTVFTPYGKVWSQIAKPKKQLVLPEKFHIIRSEELPRSATWGFPYDQQILKGGSTEAEKRLATFISSGLENYHACRNTLAHTNSQLSQDLRFGIISIRKVYQAVTEAKETLPAESQAHIQTYINELAWREFYMALLVNRPDVLNSEFDKKFKGMEWDNTSNSVEKFEKWCQGLTGFPVIDAAMRELNATGLMHNRARMLTAMFLTKDLHIDWRKGERWFMQQLIDGEIASNNGGWQWSAGTGADAAPYFRIQNPWLQTKRYDRDGEYIKRWVPELCDIQPKLFWNPPEERLSINYPQPIVTHSVEKEETLTRYRRCLGKP